MVHAIFVHGYEPWQKRNARELAVFARERLRISDSVTIDASKKFDCVIYDRLKRLLSREGDTLLYLHAHGSQFGTWTYRRDEEFQHHDIAYLVARAPGRVLAVNDSCYGARFADALEKMGADPVRVGLIASCERDTISFGGQLTDGLISAWHNRQVFGPRVMTHVCDGGPPFEPPIGTIRVYNPLLRVWDRLVYRARAALYKAACWVFPYRDWQVRSYRWGAMLDPMLWTRKRRRRRR